MNPITEMKQRKTPQKPAQMAADCKATTQTQPTTPPTAKPAENGNNSDLANGAANCKVNYPDSFHLKQLQRKQARQICEILRQSHPLLSDFTAKADTAGELSKEQRHTLRQHKRLMWYFINQFESLADYIDQVEQAQGEQLNALCYRKD